MAWVGPDNLHLTLKFLGGVDAPRLGEVTGALYAAAVGARSFDLTVAGLGAFPSATRPRVLWAGVDEGATEAAALASRIDEVLRPLGFAPEARAFTAHVTLGRVRTPRSQRGGAEALGQAVRFGRQRVVQFALMRSELSPRGARYTELAAVPLAAGSSG